jgi:hypothetical protein
MGIGTGTPEKGFVFEWAKDLTLEKRLAVVCLFLLGSMPREGHPVIRRTFSGGANLRPLQAVVSCLAAHPGHGG